MTSLPCVGLMPTRRRASIKPTQVRRIVCAVQSVREGWLDNMPMLYSQGKIYYLYK